MSIYTSKKTNNMSPDELQLVWDYKNFSYLATEER